MDAIYFPGNEVVNLFPHWADDNGEDLVPLNVHGTVITYSPDNEKATVEWEMPEQRYTVRTERDKSDITLA